MALDDGRSFVIGDMPGIIEGAAEGIGLGLQFLRHIERTKVLLLLIDMSGLEGRDPFDDFETILYELEKHDPNLMKKPQIVVANKMDMPNSEENLKKFREKLEASNKEFEVFEISALRRQGLNEVLYRTIELLEEYEEIVEEESIDMDAHVVYTHEEKEAPFELSRDSDGVWIISGEEIERLFKMTNLEHEESIMRFSRQMRAMGVDQALRDRGAKDGDLVSLLDFTFEFVE